MKCHRCGVSKQHPGTCGNCGAGQAHSLSDMSVDEISFVPRGANQKAHVVLFKSADDPPETELDQLAKELREKDIEEWGDAALTPEEALLKALDQHPELYDPLDTFSVRYGHVSKADPFDAGRRDIFVDVERLADQLQVAHHSMTRAEAVAKAVSMRPEVYDKAVLMSAEGPMQQESAR